MFLTSFGLPKETREYFLKLLSKNPKETTLAFIPTAADPEIDKWFIDIDKELIKEIGMKMQDVDLKNENENFLLEKLSKFDVIYVAGGNTFYLSDWVRKSGFDKAIKKLVEQGKIYVGSSAGSMIAGPNIESASWEVKIHDKNIVNLKDTKSLNLVPFVVSPHFVESDRPVLERRTKEVSYPVIAITDKQAVLCIDGKYQIVGKGEKLIYNNQNLRFG